MESPENSPESPAELTPAQRRSRRIRLVFQTLTALCASALTVLYINVSDTTAWGEYLTVWPPVLWLVGLVPLAILGTTRLAPRSTFAAWATVALFILLTHEIAPIIRGISGSSFARGDLRVATWNVGGSFDMNQVLTDLRKLGPDICLIQEHHAALTPEEQSDFSARWKGMHALQSGELVVISRHPIRKIPTRYVGPSSDPQLILADIGSSRTLLIANVHLMLPSLELDPFSESAHDSLIYDHQQRVAQFPKLAELMRETIAAEKPDAIILGGDFNTASHAHSLRPIRDLLDDSWLIAGRGWGGTCTTQYPVARIDQVFSNLQPIRAEVHATPTSDHLPVVVDFALAP